MELFDTPKQAPSGNPPAEQQQAKPQQIGLEGVPGEVYPKGAVPDEVENAEVNEYGERPATPEEQAVYEQFVHHAQRYINDNTAGVVQQLNQKQRPIYQNIGDTALQIVDMVHGLAKSGRGEPLDEDTLLSAGEEVVEMLMELGDAANLWPFGKDDDQYDEQMAMGLMFGAEQAARRELERGNPQQEKYENVLAMHVARERDQGQVPDEFFDRLENQSQEGVRRSVYGVK